MGVLLLACSPSSSTAVDVKEASHRLFSKLQSLQASTPAEVAHRGHLALLGSPYGLFASLHTAVTAVLHAVGNNQPLCLKVGVLATTPPPVEPSSSPLALATPSTPPELRIPPRSAHHSPLPLTTITITITITARARPRRTESATGTAQSGSTTRQKSSRRRTAAKVITAIGI